MDQIDFQLNYRADPCNRKFFLGNIFMTILKSALAAALIAASFAPSALAVPLGESGVVFTNGKTFTPGDSGEVQNDNLIDWTYDPTPAIPLNNVGGHVQNRVINNDIGTKTFMPRIRDTYNIDGGTLVISAFRLTGYAGFDVDVNYRTDGLGDKGFTSVSRSADGDIMTFRFDDPLYVDAITPPGRQQESLFSSIITDATEYDMSGTMTILGYVLPNSGATMPDPNADLFQVTLSGIVAPTTAVPLPAPLALLGAGLLGLGAVGRKKRKTA